MLFRSKLKEITPVGPTGNLRRGVSTKSKRYTKTGTAVAIVGYRKPGTTKPPKSGTKRRNKANDKTQHQFLVEYGTKERFTKGGVLSKRKARRGRMPAMHPVEQASRASESQVKGLLESEMKSAYEKALKQLSRYMAARAKKGRS